MPGTNPVSGIPWQAMAALHFLEADFTVGPTKTPGGPFQLDPGGVGDVLLERIKAAVAVICAKYTRPIGDIETDFPTAALVAAHHLLGKVRPQPYPDDDFETILADAMWGYNGRSKWHTPTGEAGVGVASWRFSPYVVNDPKAGIVLRVRGTIPDDTVPGGRRKIDRPSLRPGGMIVYRELVMRADELTV